MKLVRIAIPVALALIAWMPSSAALQKGNKELNATFSYDNIKDDEDNELTTTILDVDFGYLLTARHEIGGRLSYSKVETKVPPFVDDSTDSTEVGVFYHFNFGMEGMTTPFVGAFYTTISGDLGDQLDSRMGLEGGVKIYPWENGGFILKAVWSQLSGADNNPDADGLGVFAGVGLKW